MQKFSILTSQTIEFETEEEAIKFTKEAGYENLKGDVMIALTFENTRAQPNLLAPKIEGRMGSHFSSKKIPVKDLK